MRFNYEIYNLDESGECIVLENLERVLVPCGGKGQKAPPKIEDHTVLFGPFFNFGVFSDLSTLSDSLKPPKSISDGFRSQFCIF